MEKKKYFIPGSENAEYWDLYKEIRDNGENIAVEWDGGFTVCEYLYNGGHYIIRNNDDLGIPYSIEVLS